MTVSVKDNNTTFALINDEWRCAHENAYIQKACCYPYIGMIITCACQGADSVHCRAYSCTGINDDEAEKLFERLNGGVEY